MFIMLIIVIIIIYVLLQVEAFAAFVRNQAQYYKTNNIIITMGDDFNYQDALTYFHNLDLVIE